jgi:hypothetical protein
MEPLARSGAEVCHRLHNLQMAMEKLARGWGMSAGSTEPPPRTHAGFVQLLQHIQGMPWIAGGWDTMIIASSAAL